MEHAESKFFGFINLNEIASVVFFSFLGPNNCSFCIMIK